MCRSRFGILNNLYNELISEGINDVEIIGINGFQYINDSYSCMICDDECTTCGEPRILPWTQDIDENARDGAYITGLNLEGARWNIQQGVLDTAEPREMFCPLPVVNCKTILSNKMETNGIYECPVYQTQQRGPTYVFTAPLRTKQQSDKWVLAGVCLIMDYVD